MKKVSMLGLPFYSLSKYRGVGMAVQVLRGLGIANAVSNQVEYFNDLGDAKLSELSADSSESNLWNFDHFLRDTDTILRESSKVGSDDFVLCLGGECAFSVGTTVGLKSKFHGKPGLLWIDAHGDFNTPETSGSGFIGGMCLAFICGRGPKLSPSIEDKRPLVSEENVVHLGSRALDPLEAKAMRSSRLTLYSASEAHEIGISKVAREAASYLAERSDWVICHLDVDSIDPSVLAATNYHEAGQGLSLAEVRSIVDELYATSKLRVFNLAAYNPILDHDHESGRLLVSLISDIFSVNRSS